MPLARDTALLLVATLAAAHQLPAQAVDHSGHGGPSTLPAAGIPLYRDVLGPHRRDLRTASSEAKAYFTQGMQLLYAFAKPEAVRSFQEAQRLDPGCAMCSWGEAWARGPYLNGAMDAADGPAAHRAALRAQALASQASPADRALIAAMAVRYAPEVLKGSRKPLDSLYAREMATVYAAHPDDDDVATLYAESLMLLEPRRGTWSLEKPAVATLIGALETVLDRNRAHPGACHLYVHATESTPRAGGAEMCAELLGSAIPGVSHINHMPSHTFNRIGRWGDAVQANLRAWRTDQRAAAGEALAVYPGHNVHMLLFAASMDGQGAVADSAAREYVRLSPGGEWYRALVMLRFGWFPAILSETSRPMDAIGRGMLAFARGHAHLRLGQRDSARAHLAVLDSVLRSTSDSVVFRGHRVTHLVGITGDILRGELLRETRDLPGAIAAFERAVAAERTIRYDEPEPLNFSATDWLGAALIEAGRAADAERVYRAALDHRPNNGWSLVGLRQALEQQGKAAEAAEVQRRFTAAWARADVVVAGSRF